MSNRKERLRQVTELETKIFALRDNDGKFSIDNVQKLLKHIAKEYIQLQKGEWDAYLMDISGNFDVSSAKRKPSRTPIHKIEISDEKDFSTLTNGNIPDIIKNGLGELTYPNDAKLKIISKRKGKIRGRWEIRDKEGETIYELHGRKESIGVFEPNKK